MERKIVTQTTAADAIEHLMGLHPKGYDLSLDRVTGLLERLGNPHEKMPPVIHIAGTNGKGSATSFCRAVMEAQGLSTHVHTSPHLVHWNERYRIGHKGGPGQLVEDAAFVDAIIAGTSPKPDITDGLRAQMLADAAALSLETGQPVMVPSS